MPLNQLRIAMRHKGRACLQRRAQGPGLAACVPSQTAQHRRWSIGLKAIPREFWWLTAQAALTRTKATLLFRGAIFCEKNLEQSARKYLSRVHLRRLATR